MQYLKPPLVSFIRSKNSYSFSLQLKNDFNDKKTNEVYDGEYRNRIWLTTYLLMIEIYGHPQ